MASSLTDLSADAARQHRDFGADSLIVCDRLVRIYVAPGGIKIALQGLDLLVAGVSWPRWWAPPGAASPR